jgi:hypothetical protein
VVPKAKAKASPSTIPILQDPDLLTPKVLLKGAGFQAPRGTDTTREMGNECPKVSWKE